MNVWRLQIHFALFFSFSTLVTGKVLMKNFGNCNQKANDKAKCNATLQTTDDTQYISTNCVLTAPFDNYLKLNASIYTLLGHEYVYLFTINERKSCDAVNKYFGEMWYDMERHAGIIPELCPVAKGRYQLHNYVIDFGKMTTLSSFPFGNLRFVGIFYNTKDSVYACFVTEVENRLCDRGFKHCICNLHPTCGDYMKTSYVSPVTTLLKPRCDCRITTKYYYNTN